MVEKIAVYMFFISLIMSAVFATFSCGVGFCISFLGFYVSMMMLFTISANDEDIAENAHKYLNNN